MDEEWKKLNFYVDFYRFNWQLIKSLMFIVLGLSGTVSAFCLTQGDIKISRYALLVPIIIYMFLCLLMAYSIKPIMHNAVKVKHYAKSVGMMDAPDLNALVIFMGFVIFVTILVTVGLIGLYCFLLKAALT